MVPIPFPGMSSLVKRKASGAENRKRKAEKEAEKSKASGSLLKFFKLSEIVENNSDVGANAPEKESNVYEDEAQTHTIAECSTFAAQHAENDENSDPLVSQDPQLWPPELTNRVIEILIGLGPPKQPSEEFVFPLNQAKRKFTLIHYFRHLSNGERLSRKWLVYSTSGDTVHCFCCKIFAPNKNSLSSAKGYSEWKNVGRTLSDHEKSLTHMECYRKWHNLQCNLQNKHTIDAAQQRILDSEKRHGRLVMERLIAITQFLGQQCLAFRGSSELVFTNNNGNYLKLCELLAKFDSTMSQHLSRVAKEQKCGKRRVNYLGKTIQNELITLISHNILQHILKEIAEVKYFSVILDCTPDISKTEQITVIVRFVTYQDTVQVHEHFLGFSPVIDATGKGLTEFLLKFLNENNLNIQNLRGQGYDNGSNMRGKNSGVQKRVLEINPRAFYVPCCAHTLNLTVNDAVKISFEVVEFFNLVQQVYVFFAASGKRWSVLKEHITKLTLKPLCDTRWESRIDAINPLRYQCGETYDALLEISLDEKLDNLTRHEAKSLAAKIKNFTFICTLVLWCDILNQVNTVSKLLQAKNLDLLECVNALNRLKAYFCDLRTDEAFESFLNKAHQLAEEVDIEANFPACSQIRPRRKKCLFNYEAQDDIIQDPRTKYKVEVYFKVLDVTITSIQDRFDLLRQHSSCFSFLCDTRSLQQISEEQLLENCINLAKHLSDPNNPNEKPDIDGEDLCREILSSRIHFTDEVTTSPMKILQYIISNSLLDILPNLVIALRILLTIPVTVASGERSFSKLKLIKNYLRSTISQERLTGLAMLSIEHELAESLNYEDLINDFSEQKCRRLPI